MLTANRRKQNSIVNGMNETAETYSVWPVFLLNVALWLYFTGLVNLNRLQRLRIVSGSGSSWVNRSDLPDYVASWVNPSSSFRAVLSMVMMLALPATPFLLWGPDVRHPLFLGMSGAWLLNVSTAGLLVSPLIWWSFLPARVSLNGVSRPVADLRVAIGITLNCLGGVLLLAGLSYISFLAPIFDFVASSFPAISKIAVESGFADRCIVGVAIVSIVFLCIRVFISWTTHFGLCCATVLGWMVSWMVVVWFGSTDGPALSLGLISIVYVVIHALLKIGQLFDLI